MLTTINPYFGFPHVTEYGHWHIWSLERGLGDNSGEPQGSGSVVSQAKGRELGRLRMYSWSIAFEEMVLSSLTFPSLSLR